jgi:hypothetical protein
MKKTILTVLTVFTFLTVFGQEKIVSYEMSHFGKDKDVTFSTTANKYYIDVMSQNKPDDLVSINVPYQDIEDFKTLLTEAKDVYSKLSISAKENNTTKLDKEIDLKKLKIATSFNTHNTWYFDFDVHLKANFKVIEGKHLLVFTNRNKLKSSSNESIHHKGFSMIFSSVDEIERFISTLSRDTSFEENYSKEDLFRD